MEGWREARSQGQHGLDRLDEAQECFSPVPPGAEALLTARVYTLLDLRPTKPSGVDSVALRPQARGDVKSIDRKCRQ